MGKPTGFMEIPRETPTRRPIPDRVNDFLEVYNPFSEEKLRAQGARCMDCGIPFCHQGCPLGNLIPDWNDLVYRDKWRAAIDRLHATNNFPEFTGTLCPAPCEASGVLGINSDAVTAVQRMAEFDAVCLCGGATQARDLSIPGRDLSGIHFAMDYLPLQNRRGAGDQIPDHEFISAQGKRVIIIGGGDTGADCLG